MKSFPSPLDAAPQDPPRTQAHRLAAGEQLRLQARRGTEVFCAAGTVDITAPQPWLGERASARTLHAGQGWRASEPTPVVLAASGAGPARVRITRTPGA